MDMSALKPNEKKSLEIETSGGTYQRYQMCIRDRDFID